MQNLKAIKIKSDFKYEPNYEFFLGERGLNQGERKSGIRKSEYQTLKKCKFCGVDNTIKNLKYKLSVNMVLETAKMYEHADFRGSSNKFKCLERPDLKHDDYSMIYLPYRVCEDCYLLYETLHDIKEYQIQIGNILKSPVNEINFGFGYYFKEKNDIKQARQWLKKAIIECPNLRDSYVQRALLEYEQGKSI